MIRRAALITLVLLLSVLGIITTVSAQENNGFISGVVFDDLNTNGICTGENEPGVMGIPLQLVNRDDNTIINLTSGSGGYYELTNASEGTWQVTVNPGSGWRVTSQQTRQVLVTEEEPDVEDVDFCIVQVATETPTGTPAGTPTVTPAVTPTATTIPPVLPESGAPLSPLLLLAFGLGLLFLVTGALLLAHARRR